MIRFFSGIPVDKWCKLCYNIICIFYIPRTHGVKRKETNTMMITKDTIIGDILDIDAQAAAPIFFEMGMHCLGCPASRGESVEQACMVHGVDVEEIVAQLNEALGNNA